MPDLVRGFPEVFAGFGDDDAAEQNEGDELGMAMSAFAMSAKSHTA